MTKYGFGVPPLTLGKDDVVSLDLEIVGAKKPLHVPTGDLGICSVSTHQGTWIMTEVQEIKQFARRAQRATWALHNSLYDLKHLERWGIDTSDLKVWDTMLFEQMTYGGYYSQFDLASLVRRRLRKYRDKTIRDDFPEMTSRSQINNRHHDYAAEDAEDTRALALLQMEEDPTEIGNYWRIEEPAVHAVLAMTNPRIDVDAWLVMVAGFEAEAERIRKELGFNFRSPDQVKEAVKHTLKVSLEDTTDEVLAAYAGTELIDLIRKGREYATLASTYGRKWVEKHVVQERPGLWIVRPGWKIIGADTDRMACSDPNMQNIPVREHPEYRATVIARDGHKVAAMDAKAQELRCIAHICKDERLIQMLKDGVDPYMEVAVKIMGAKNRSAGKSILLGLDYGMTAYGLAPRLGVSEEKAEEYIQKFYRMFPGIHAYLTTGRSKAERFGYVRDSLGGRTHVNLYSKQWKNNAVNAPVQRTAALVTKKALSLQHEACRAEGWPFYTMLVVHDETDGDVPNAHVKKYTKLAREAWIEAARVVIPSVPFEVDFAIGKDWGCKH